MKNDMIAPTGIFAVLAVAFIAGVANAKPPQKIVGGSGAAPGEFPYQVSLRLGNQHLCGGTIISKRHIITAARCVVGQSPWSLSVATGTIHSTGGGQLHSVAKIVSHPGYNPRKNGNPNDIAIITLGADISYNKYQNKLDLPTAPTPDGVTALATGWGYTAVNAISPKLLKVELQTISQALCQQLFGPIGIFVYSNQICSYSPPGVGTCLGDSGGPLAYNGKLIGVTSYGIPCARGYPDVFTSTYHNLNWIKQQTANQ